MAFYQYFIIQNLCLKPCFITTNLLSNKVYIDFTHFNISLRAQQINRFAKQPIQSFIFKYTLLNSDKNELIAEMIRSIKHSAKDYALQISAITWKKNYQNLFDYDQCTQDLLLTFYHQLRTKDSFFLIWRDRKSLKIKVETKKQLRKMQEKQIDENEQLLLAAKTSTKDRIFTIKLYQPDEIIRESESEECYLEHHVVVRSLKNQDKEPIGFVLKSNNIIKLGNCEFFVHLVHTQNFDQFFMEADFKKNKNLEIGNDGMTLDKVTFFVNSNQKVYDASLEQNLPEAECKYCMMPQSQGPDEFLCSPCKCSGSCGMVHFNCLVKWNQQKVKKTQNKGCVQYNYQKFFCEVCKQEYPQYIKKHKKVHQILPIVKPKGDYIIMEALSSNKRHIIIVQNLGEEGLTVGRGQESDLKFDDPTISRRHAVIKKQGNYFKLYDLKSKFGTLVKDMSLSFSLKTGEKISVQSGRSVISFSLLKKQNYALVVPEESE